MEMYHYYQHLSARVTKMPQTSISHIDHGEKEMKIPKVDGRLLNPKSNSNFFYETNTTINYIQI